MDIRDRRKLTEKAMSINPSQIEITRVGRIPDGAGGWLEEQSISVPAQTVRIYVSRHIKEVSQEGGQFQLKTWEMLCPWDADIKAHDEFEANSTRYRVVSIKPIRYLGEVVSHQAVIEEVS